LLPTLLFGLGTWVSFGYIAARHRQVSWAVAAVVYLLLDVVSFALIIVSPATEITTENYVGLVLWLLTWLTGIGHAVWVNFTVRLDLEATPGS